MPTRGDVNKIFKPSPNGFEMQTWRRSIKPYWLYFDGQDGALTFSAGAANNTQRPKYRQQSSSNNWLDASLRTPFLIQQIVHTESENGTANSNFTIQIRQRAAARDLMSRPIHIRTFAGTAQTPALLREPLLFPSNSFLDCTITRIENTNLRNLRMYLCGSFYTPWANDLTINPDWKARIVDIVKRWEVRNRYVIPYWITPDTDVELTADTASEFFFKNSDDSCIEIFGATAVSDGAFSMEISETRTRTLLQNGVVTNTNAIGNANFPAIWPTTYLLYPGYRLRFKLTDLSSSGNTVYLTLFGRKIYAKPDKVLQVLKDTEVGTPQSPSDQQRVFEKLDFQSPVGRT